jgi:hypothetical protein
MAAVVRGADSRAFRGRVRLVIARPIGERCPSWQAVRPSATRRRAMVSFPDATGRSRAGSGMRDESCVADARIEAPFVAAQPEAADALCPPEGRRQQRCRPCRSRVVPRSSAAEGPRRLPRESWPGAERTTAEASSCGPGVQRMLAGAGPDLRHRAMIGRCGIVRGRRWCRVIGAVGRRRLDGVLGAVPGGVS